MPAKDDAVVSLSPDPSPSYTTPWDSTAAEQRGASKDRLAELQKLAVEETIKGLDINPVSLQLAASQLTTGNQEIRYRQMGLDLMAYGPTRMAQSASPLALLNY